MTRWWLWGKRLKELPRVIRYGEVGETAALIQAQVCMYQSQVWLECKVMCNFGIFQKNKIGSWVMSFLKASGEGVKHESGGKGLNGI